MKIKFLLLFVFIILFQAGYAQRFGIQGGLNISKTSNIEGYSDTSLPALHLGVVVEFSLTKRFCFNTGLMYSVKGYKYNTSFNTGSGYGSGYGGNDQSSEDPGILRYSTGYLEIPANLAFKFPITNKLNLSFHTGPTFSYGLYFKCRGSKSSANDYTFFHLDSKQRYDFGMNLGSDIEFENINVGVNYNQGLKNLSYSSGTRNNNRVLQLSVAYMFGKKTRYHATA